MKKKTIALMLALNMLFSPAGALRSLPVFAAPSSNELPVNGTVVSGKVTIPNTTPNNVLNITQTSAKAVIKWDKFNIGSAATVRFYQGTGTPGTVNWKPNSSYAALNRIYDQNPSQIFGKLIADGKVYLINQNGILFGKGSQVNVNTLIASTLNLRDKDFQAGLLRFTAENYQDPGYIQLDSNMTAANYLKAVLNNVNIPHTAIQDAAAVTVENDASITAGSGGRVCLIGPSVINGGSITAQSGIIDLIGVTNGATRDSTSALISDVEITEYPTQIRPTNDVVYWENAAPGQSSNNFGGSLIADSGRVYMYGNTVTQNGLIRAITSVKQGGQIYLVASSEIDTGPNSVTDVSLSNSSDKISQTFTFTGGSVNLWGLSTGNADYFANTANSTPTRQAVAKIDHKGVINAPAGSVELDANKEVYLENGSSIDVGGVWVDEPVTATLVQAQLNTLNLADYYGQKNGILLGQNITTTLLNGSNIGDISGAYTTAEKTTLERGTKGGTINIGALNVPDQFVLAQGATVDFSGGGVRYAGGTVQTTKLISGNSVYDISTAPAWLTYQSTFLGSTYSPAYVVGSDAGSLNILAHKVYLGGNLKGSVTQGLTQTNVTSGSTQQNYNISVARGLEAPVGGKVTIGYDFDPADNPSASNFGGDFITDKIEVFAKIPIYDQLNPPVWSELSAENLSNAGLSALSLYANTSITIDPGARLTLRPTGSFTAKAWQISDGGEIYAPGGSAEFTLLDSKAPNSQSTQAGAELLSFSAGSLVSLNGEAINNSMASPLQPVQSGAINGGNLIIQDLTYDGTTTGHTLLIDSGALLNVSGGYQISQTGTITGGDAGSITLKSRDMILTGDFLGLALPGKKGGTINLHAGEIEVGKTGSDSTTNGKLLLAQDRFNSGGFTNIGLTAIGNITFDAGSDLEPSTVRLNVPMSGAAATFVPAAGIFSSDYLGKTSITATAGATIIGVQPNGDPYDPPSSSLSKLSILAGATVGTAPGGAITLKGPTVEIDGNVRSLAGNVSVTATPADSNQATGDLTINGSIVAAGYNKPNSDMVAGLSAGLSPQSAGTISLTSKYGSINLNPTGTLDISGAGSTVRLVAGVNGIPVPVIVAGNPGSLNLSYNDKLNLNGSITAKAGYSGIQGGTLSVTKTINGGSTSGLDLTGEYLNKYTGAGFDSLAFQSVHSVNFLDDINMTAGRRLILDTPVLQTSSNAQVTLIAPWVSLQNSSGAPAAAPAQMDSGSGRLTIHATGPLAVGELDVTGSILVSGFHDVNLMADGDLTLTDRYYSSEWAGELGVTGNLNLTAKRIYPTTASSFTIVSMGTITTKADGADSSPIYSAGGNLTLNGYQGIDHEGVIAAPMGSVTLESVDGNGNKSGEVYLGKDSVVTTAGDAQVSYGTFDGTTWSMIDPVGQAVKIATIANAPEKSITINGNEVVVGPGAKVDFSGGGSVFTYLYQPDLQGTTDPISKTGTSALTGLPTRSNRYVILPDNSVQLPAMKDLNGNVVSGAIHLNGIRLDNGTWLKAGTYELLPEQFAFIPGALIISDLGKTVAPGLNMRTTEGYQVVGGYATNYGTKVSSGLMEGYSIRESSDVLQEGNFTVKQYVAKDAGALSIKGNTTIMAGSLKAAALAGGNPGSLILSGQDINVRENATPLPANFGFGSPLPAGISTGDLQIAGSVLSGSGLGTLTLGDANTTTSLTVTQGSTLNVPNINLISSGTITVESGATVKGVSVNVGGSGDLATAAGALDIQAGGTVYGAKSVTVNAGDYNLQGDLSAGSHGSMKLTAGEVFFVPDTYTKNGNGLYLTKNLWNGFANYDQVTLASRSDFNFQSDVSMTAGKSLTLDTGAYTVTGSANVVISASSIELRNSSGAAGTLASSTGAGSLTFNAEQISVSLNSTPPLAGSATGDIVFNGVAGANLTSQGDLTLRGVGSLMSAGDLNLKAARLTTSYYKDNNTSYTAADFLIDAAGAVVIANSGGAAGSSATPGGTLAIQGGSISQTGVIDVPSGSLTMTATSGDITLGKGARILAGGIRQANAGTATTGEYDYYPGGTISLTSVKGMLDLQEGSLLDVHAADQGNAGAITLAAPSGGVSMNGDLLGSASTGYAGGSFTLDTTTLDTVGGVNAFATLNSKLAAGGFNERLDIRARNGNITVGGVAAHELFLEADGNDGMGSIYVNGAITATQDSGGNGGTVSISAARYLDLAAGSSIDVHGAAQGGQVLLGAGSVDSGNNPYGMLSVESGAVIDASGTASGGTVHFRAMRTADNSDILMSFNGTVKGASSIEAEGVKVYQYNGDKTITSADVSTSGVMYTEAAFFTSPGNFIGANITALTGTPVFHLLSGIEMQSTGNITLNTNWDFNTWRNANAALGNGILTLRAAGDLIFNGNLTDHPTVQNFTNKTYLTSSTMQNSWGFNIVAGADLKAANPLAINTGTGTGDLTINGGKVVYTENAAINFAAGNNVNINTGYAAGFMLAQLSSSNSITQSLMRYSLASYGGNIKGRAGNGMNINGGAIQTAVGNIDLRVGGDLTLQYNGAIRTTGEYDSGAPVEQGLGTGVTRAASITDFWTYHNGGGIDLDVGGSVNGFVNSNTAATQAQAGLANSWDYTYGGGTLTVANVKQKMNPHLSASFEGVNSTAGIATMGGGDIRVRTGGAFLSQIGTFGTVDTGRGNLDIVAGSDIRGRFRVSNGTATLTSGGSFLEPGVDASGNPIPEVIELINGQFNLTAQGDIHVGAIIDPDNSRWNLFYKGTPYGVTNGYWNMTFKDSAVRISSLTGNVVLSGTDKFDGYYVNQDSNTDTLGIDYSKRQLILPSSVSLLAAGDVLLQSDYYMAPSPQGELSIYAGKNINGLIQSSPGLYTFAQIVMNDGPVSAFNGYQMQNPDFTSSYDSTQSLIHRDDSIPVVIKAGADIMDLQLDMAKSANISAGLDISELHYMGQNINPTDVTSISAGRDILYSYVAQVGVYLASINPADTGIRLNGPGVLLVQAGRNIDLGSSAGIQSLGNEVNPSLGSEGSDILVAAGAAKEFPVSTGITAGSAFFNDEDGLKYVASDYKTLLDEASKSSGAALVTVAEKLIKETPDLITQAGKGSIGLTLAGNAYATLLSLSKNTTLSLIDQQKLNAYAQQLIVQARNAIITPWFDLPASDGSGSISLTRSQIATVTGKDDIYILARGDLNVGKTALTQSSSNNTGIYTDAGGGINIYSGGDINVNESRVMTFLSGNITVWSDKGSINAGRGSKTQVSPPTRVPLIDANGNIIGYGLTPPAVGSGIRALTFDPNIVPGGPLAIPAPGDIYLFAPQGVIDAGEAGIAGGRVVTGATEVLNAKNISFSVGSVGVPSGSGNSVNLGSLAGAGSVAETSKMVAQASALGGAKDSLAQSNVVDQFLSKFLDVKVIDFDTDEGKADNDKQDKEKKKKK
ncbi:MAG: filamentous hemagglutinin family protein [Geobacteraceae bacterium]